MRSLWGKLVISARADAAEEEAPAPAAAADAPAPPPPEPPKPIKKKQTLESLTPEQLEELKQEVVNEVVDKIAGPDNERLEDFLEPELVTAPYDPRFPNRNQARHCFVRFNEFFKCSHERGEDHPRCVFYKRAYESMCPSEWVENWMELREKGLWTGKY